MTDVNNNLESIAEAPKKPAMMKKKAVKKPAKKKINYNLKEPLKANQKLQPGFNAPFDPSKVTLPPALIAKWLGNPKKISEMEALAKQIADLKKQIDIAKKKEEALNRKKEKIEASQPISDEKTLKYFKLIEKECSQYIKNIKIAKNFLYRGVNKAPGNAFIGKPFNKRKPLDSTKEFQNTIDNALSTMGFKALRGNSIFTSGDVDQASGYGDTYIIFPKNGFSFTWSTTISDLHDDTSDWDDEDEDEFYYFAEDTLGSLHYALNDFADIDLYSASKTAERDKKIVSSPVFNNTVKLIKKAYNYTNLPNIKNAVNAFVDLEKKVNYKFKFDSRADFNDIIKYISNLNAPSNNKNEAIKLIKKYHFQQDKLVAAIQSGNEVYVTGEYIALNLNDYGRAACLYFIGKIPNNIKYYIDD